MRICTDPTTKEYYSFDSQAYMRFLVAQGFTEHEINMLTIYLECVPDPSMHAEASVSDRTMGLYRPATYAIYVWHRYQTFNIDNTLLHETRHYWQHLRKTHSFSKEQSIAYLDRPHEIDARQFATTHAGQHFFQRTTKLSPADEAGLTLVAGMALFTCVLAVAGTIQRLCK